MRLPDFLIIGAMKSGTSSLHDYLGQHPEVFASRRKELDFFCRRYSRGIDWYARQFGPGIAGESSPNYLKAHLWRKTAGRIRRHLPQARLVCVLRNPIDRTLSHYLHALWRGRETRPFSEAAHPDGNLIMSSRYGWQLDRYLAQFPADQIMLLTTEELGRDPEGATRRVLRFIGVDNTVTIDTSRRRNVTAVNLAEVGVQVPEDPAIVVDDERIGLAPDARAALAEEFRADVDRLRSSWPGFAGWHL